MSYNVDQPRMTTTPSLNIFALQELGIAVEVLGMVDPDFESEGFSKFAKQFYNPKHMYRELTATTATAAQAHHCEVYYEKKELPSILHEHLFVGSFLLQPFVNRSPNKTSNVFDDPDGESYM